MKIIYIHGMNKQKFSSASLRQRWLSLLKRGLEQSHQQTHFAYLKRHIRIPFYGDLLSRHHLHNVLNASTLMPQDWPRFPFQSPVKSQPPPPHLSQYSPEICEIPELKVEDAMTFNQKLQFISTLSRNTLLRDFVILLNHFPRLHDTLIKKFLIETYSYLANSTFMQQVHQRIGQQLHGDKPCILMAHSLGSVIAYHYLLLHPELNVQRFISMGSPMAFRVIQEHLPQPVHRPEAIKGDWINFYCSDDFLTAFPLSEPPFQFQPAIINQEIRTSIYHPHDIDGYVQHPEVIKALLEML